MGGAILIVGASGLVGRRLAAHLGPRAQGTAFRGVASGLHTLDIRDEAAVQRRVEALAPSVIVHTAAWTDVDGCELDPDRSRAVNVDGTRHVARAAARIGARYILFSTDYVFGGEAGPHRVDEEPAPMNVYGRHKLEGERLALELVGDAVVVRGCNVFGYQPGGRNYVLGVVGRALAGEPVRAAMDQWGCPTLAEDLCAVVERLVDRDVRGVLHAAGPDYVTREDWARRALTIFGLDPAIVEPLRAADLAQKAPRPSRGGLDATDTQSLLDIRFTPLDRALEHVAEQWRAAGEGAQA